MPQPKAEMAKAAKRLRQTSMPMLVAASSLSRTAISPRPRRERTSA